MLSSSYVGTIDNFQCYKPSFNFRRPIKTSSTVPDAGEYEPFDEVASSLQFSFPFFNHFPVIDSIFCVPEVVKTNKAIAN